MISCLGLITLFSGCWFDYFVSWFPGLITLFPGAGLITLFSCAGAGLITLFSGAGLITLFSWFPGGLLCFLLV